MPGIFRLSRDLIVEEAKRAYKIGITAVALFPVIPEKRKDRVATASKDAGGLLQKTVHDLKSALPAGFKVVSPVQRQALRAARAKDYAHRYAAGSARQKQIAWLEINHS